MHNPAQRENVPPSDAPQCRPPSSKKGGPKTAQTRRVRRFYKLRPPPAPSLASPQPLKTPNA
jgi:hypothetical protein